jgi:plastocyanin
MRLSCKKIKSAVFLAAMISSTQCRAQEPPVSLNVVITRAETTNAKAPESRAQFPDVSNAAVWLTPLDRNEGNTASQETHDKAQQLVQRHKTFEPHVLIVPVGTRVEFPNKDPFFHNIFSLFDGKRFDLGLYEAGTTRTVLFDRPGVSFLFCNIHAEMSAVVLSVDTPYFGLSDRTGNIQIHNVPNGRYQMSVWFERATPENLKRLSRIVTISNSSRSLGTIRIQENPNFTLAHKNKYGLNYVPPPQSDYDHP